ncbi:MAG TPA: hypothetical protein VH880_00075 [Anaeromyxobacteraceae bacterium]|jgi:hypothetical protein
MAKALAVLRTLYLVFIVGYTVRALPLALLWSGESKRGVVTVGLDTVEQVARAAWLAVGWIALEVALGWARVWIAGRSRAGAPPPVAPRA